MSTADLDPAIYMRPRQMAFGLGWAARRSLLARHGFYDALVVGSGDRALSCAAYGRPDNAIVVTRMNPRQTAHYLRWASRSLRRRARQRRLRRRPALPSLARRSQESPVPPATRAFSAYAFDPSVDIVVNSSGRTTGGPSPRPCRVRPVVFRLAARGCGLRGAELIGEDLRSSPAHRSKSSS